MQQDFSDRGLAVAGVTFASAADAEAFRRDRGVDYPVVADAQALFDAWGVNAVWGSVVYLIDADGRIVARGIDRARAVLTES